MQQLKPHLQSLCSTYTRSKRHSDRDILGFISLASSCHPRHGDIIANLGYSNIAFCYDIEDIINENYSSSKLDETVFVSHQVLSRRPTSNGAVVTTCKVEILNEKYEPLCTLFRRLLEKILPFEHFPDEGDELHCEIPKPRRDKGEIRALMKTGKLLVKENIKSPNPSLHYDYCSLMNLDAPLHYAAGDSTHIPTIPSMIHFACHGLCSNGGFDDVTFHNQMKPSTPYTRCIYAIGESVVPGTFSYLSVIQDENRSIFSTVFFERKEFNPIESCTSSDHIDELLQA